MRKIIFSLSVALSSVGFAQEPISPIEPTQGLNPDKVELGKQLFFDTRLSRSGIISCNSCHNLAIGGTDNLPSSIGHGWAMGPINAPTVLNAKYHLAQFWDGRATDLQEQAGGPIQAGIEMGSNHSLAVQTIASIDEYQKQFESIFENKKVDITNITDAIATFEETLVTPNAPFDQYLKGDESAISDQAKQGYATFKEIGCAACHNGEAVGGTSFQKMGLVKPFVTENPSLGRFGVTNKESDKMVFKVPGLRNLHLTAPYFHDGSSWDLAQAVNLMADIQLGRQLTKKQTADILAFLDSLNGDRIQISLPVLPSSNFDTPKPDVSLKVAAH